MKKKIEIILIIIIAVVFIYFCCISGKNSEVEDKANEVLSSTQTNHSQKVNELKTEFGMTGDTEIYTVVEEYDGRKTLAIKPDLQYKVAMAGILKDAMPEYQELDAILEKAPKNKGIWVSNRAKEKMLETLQWITGVDYSIDENGYLQQQKGQEMNSYDEKISQILARDKLYVIDINSSYYILDNVTGEIMENPFEKMDPYTPYEYVENGNSSIWILATNHKNKLSYEEILKEILENIM